MTTDSVELTALFEESQTVQNYAIVSQKVTTFDHTGSISSNLTGGNIIGGTSFSFGSSPTFHALANTGYKFVGWADSQGEILETSSKYTFIINDNIIINAIFEELSFEVVVNSSPSEKGSVRWDGKGESHTFTQTLPYGEIINLYALPNQGYGFMKWTSVNFQLQSPENPVLTINGLNQNIELNATFSQDPPLFLNIQITPQTAGWAIGNGAYDYKSSHLIFAKTNPGYLFSHWSGDGIQNPLSANTSILLDQNKTVTAYFVEDPDNPPEYDKESSGLYNLLVISSNSEQGIAAGSGVYSSGWVGVYAQANEGYLFDQWTGGEFSETASSNSQYRLSDDSIITANFKVQPIIPDSVELGSGWMISEWLGTYWMQPNQKWVYHAILGWIYIHLIDNQDLWIWSDRLSTWMWTGKALKPYFFLYEQGSWIYFNYSTSKYYLYKDANINNQGEWFSY